MPKKLNKRAETQLSPADVSSREEKLNLAQTHTGRIAIKSEDHRLILCVNEYWDTVYEDIKTKTLLYSTSCL